MESLHNSVCQDGLVQTETVVAFPRVAVVEARISDFIGDALHLKAPPPSKKCLQLKHIGGTWQLIIPSP